MSYSELHIFSMSIDGTLQVVSQKQFIAFENGDQPITSFNEKIDTDNMQIKLLFLTLRDGICELVEPLRINVDTHGFLDRRDHQIVPLPTKEKPLWVDEPKPVETKKAKKTRDETKDFQTQSEKELWMN